MSGDRSDAGEAVDPVTLEVVRNACAAVCEEMNATLVRTSYSPNIKERKDCSCALFDANGTLVSQAENLPVHLGAMPFSVAAALEAFPPADLEPGDAVLLNDPYEGGAHLPDLTLVSPVFHDGTLVAFTANRAHHADVGGATAGSVGADSTEIYQEGLRIPPVKLREGGAPNAAVYDLIERNVRTPEERRGDLRAQVAANETGAERFEELVDRYGFDTLSDALTEIQDYSERRMRAELAEIPDGEYRFEDALDDDGRGNEDLPVVARVTVDGDSVLVDFDGTAPQTEGPINAVAAVTASATYYAVRAVTDPDIPPNAGCYRPIEIDAPSGTVVNPDPPAAVVGGNLETSQRVTDVVLGAFAQAVPERAVAGCQGTMNNVTFGGADESGEPFAFYETQAGGFGAHAAGDGMDAVHVHMSNTLNTPAEVLETAYPLRVRRYALRPDTGGAGEYRGGLGLRRDIEVRTDAVCSLLADRQRHAPYGLEGGEPGATGETFVVRQSGDGAEERVDGKSTHELDAGDVVSLRTPGAGGYGDPAERDAMAIERDLRLEKLTADAARESYDHEE
ncbi:hydantoinase B/oxoprolinase family protein [Natronomonas salina]|uniref:hydantoinase B/oxoprolinase family protein n=1 Tax=Natronomonas salina TaxID=1710540 RepID=UPI0015B751A0|nr:hydantoinase B/oxoprolinase family protein [Natronomonas salina]QLD87699.1 hydantoinase B/oxoprolinase family protein [Natronomonas salina]